MRSINVMSLFDGMSCGRVALEKLGIEVDHYLASEIDKFAIKVAKDNYPETIHIWDVTEVKWTQDDQKIDLLIWGSPCQGFSSAGKQENFNDPRSKLFFEFVRLLDETRPKYFLLENVKMKKEYQDKITHYLGWVMPIEINSSLVSWQKRKRLYWVWELQENWKYMTMSIPQPEDKKIFLKDILLDHSEVDPKYFMSQNWLTWWKEKWEARVKKWYSAINPEKALTMLARQYDNWDGTFIYQIPRGQNFGSCHVEKSPTISSHSWQCNNLLIKNDRLRKMTPVECERLQNLPDNYSAVVSDAQRYKMTGNGWDVWVIKHIISFMKF